MSAAATAQPVLTAGYARVPNSFIENQGLFTPAERALMLIVLRRENNEPGRPVKVSDETWQKWTGLEPRTKKAAVAGLAKKCLTVRGHGDSAGYSFARQQWETFVKQLNRDEYRPRTAGRGVDPRPGAKIHPSCRERGCSLMSRDGLTPTGSTLNVQRVAQIEGADGCRPDGAGGVGDQVRGSGLTPLSVIPNVQRVARSVSGGVEVIWGRTLAALQQLFPLVDVVFLVRLIAVVRALFADVQDGELAQAVEYAYSLKSEIQRSEGMFLLTVPRAVAALREGRGKKPRGKPTEAQQAIESGRGLLEGVWMLQDRVTEALRARGAPFAALAGEVSKLRADTVENVDLADVQNRMLEIEAAVIQASRDNLTDLELEQVTRRADEAVKPGLELWSKIEIERCRKTVTEREILSLLGIPRLSLFSA